MNNQIRKQWAGLVARGATMAVMGEKISHGINTHRKAIVVGVKEKIPLKELRANEIIPSKLDGIETDVIVFHQPDILPKVLASDPERLKEHRPAFGGISIGHPDITAGTLGGLVYRNGKQYAITNWHVGNMNDGQIGDPMWQPGVYDGGTADNFLGTIAFKPPVEFVGGLPSDCPIAGGFIKATNLVARAIGSRTRIQAIRPLQTENLVDMCLVGPLDEELLISLIYEIGWIDTRSWCEFKVGDRVIKSGRTSGLGSFITQQIGASVRVGMGGTQSADFHDQIIFSANAEGGDSGSLILKDGSFQNNYVGALLFAGSDQNTIGCRWHNVKTIGGLD